MQPFDYIEEANRTMSANFHKGVPAVMVAGVLKMTSDHINALDAIKKKLFYGRANMGMDSAIELARQSGLNMDEIDFEKLMPTLPREDAIRIFHGVIGAVTEAGEMALALAEAISHGTPLDLVNISEEFGDQQWYIAATLRAMGRTFDDVHRQNIAKLRLRYPDKFTEHNANNRDLGAERKLLERTTHDAEGDVDKLLDGAVGFQATAPHIQQLELDFGGLDYPRAPGGGENDIHSSRIVRNDVAK